MKKIKRAVLSFKIQTPDFFVNTLASKYMELVSAYSQMLIGIFLEKGYDQVKLKNAML